jgi:nucleoside-diphosphate-sugar epimerase
MRVFITGATGFLGGALARALARMGAEVHALVRFTSGRSGLDRAGVTCHEGDVTRPATLTNALDGADWVVHAAGRLGEFGVREEIYQQVHVEGTRNVMTAAMQTGCQTRVLHVSTTGVLGLTPPGPAMENLPYAPANPYERTKAAAEQVALEFASKGLPVIVCRPAFVYGPGDRHVLGLFQAVRRGRFFLIDGAEHLCHPTFITDTVAGMLLCLRLGRSGEIYHIAGPRAVTFREFAETIAGALGVRPPRLILPRWVAMLAAMGLEKLGQASGRKPPLSRAGVAFFSQDRCYSWQRAHDELGYTPEFDLATGIARTVAGYRGEGLL